MNERSRSRNRQAADIPPAFRPGDREPPNCPEAETAVLGLMLVDEVAASRAPGMLTEGDFFHPGNQIIFRSCVRLFVSQITPDAVTVATDLRSSGDLDAAGGIRRLHELVGAHAAPSSLEFYCKQIRGASARRAMIQAAALIVSEGYATSEITPEEFLQRAAASVLETTRAAAVTAPPTRQAGEAAAEYLGGLEARRAAGRLGIPSGISTLDEIARLWQKRQLVILGARPSMGKSGAAIQFALTAARQGYGTLFFSLEMDTDSVENRLLSNMTRIPGTRITDGLVAAGEREALDAAAAELAALPLWINDKSHTTLTDIRAEIMRYRASGTPIEFVVVDYFQLMEPPDTRVSREQQVTALSSGLKALAKEEDVAVLALSQLNRALESRPIADRQPRLSDLRESGSVEQDADKVVFLFREEYYLKDKCPVEKQNVCEMIVAKHRNGPTGVVRTYIDLSCGWFAPLAQDDAPTAA